jgi:(E)-4-hydroxy-3-methylbut-2-enyl-diphosphate synthase
VNPGNFADKKKFAIREYTDDQYDEELARIDETFQPLVELCKQRGIAMRIGTNHGSLSDRIMNRFGDTPAGMVESAVEFARIARKYGYHDFVFSMKSSNPKVMINAYRLLAARLLELGPDWNYPLHLGVTEAGDGEDGRIKGAIGIGSLLLDGLGDTIRVSLTEDSVYEIPVARAIADKAMSLWNSAPATSPTSDSVDPYHFSRREIVALDFGNGCPIGTEQPPRVIVRAKPDALSAVAAALQDPRLLECPVEGVLVAVGTAQEAARVASHLYGAPVRPAFIFLEPGPGIEPADLDPAIPNGETRTALVVLRRFDAADGPALARWVAHAQSRGSFLAAAVLPRDVPALAAAIPTGAADRLIFTLDPGFPPGAGESGPRTHSLGAYRLLAEALSSAGLRSPIWIRNTPGTAIRGDNSFLSRLLEASFLTGGLLCDGIGDLLSIETEPDPARAARLSYNVLQGAGARISKTEFVACPSCGRTLFDLQETTQRIRSQTGHLKGVKIAIMGCIVNGPGEMADADFGYVGGAPGKINLYVGKQCVQYNIPQAEADGRLMALIREHGKWVEPALPG